MKTRDYAIFKNITGNRKINVSHVESLAEAIERKNLLQYFPILVNERMEVIDGQHRLMAAAKLGYDVHYEVVDGLKLEHVMSINTHSKNWSINDFIDAYIKLGYPDYQQLKEFMNTYQMGATISASLLKGFSYLRGGSGVSNMVREGTFHIASFSLAKTIAEQVIAISMFADFPASRDRELIMALMLLKNNENFDFDKLTTKMRFHNLKLEKRPSTNYYVLEIEELYNHYSKHPSELYASTVGATA